MNPLRPGGGRIEVVAGPMFSGKSEELIRLLRRAAIARQRVQVFKPALDNRYSQADVVSHSQWRIPCEAVERAADIQGRLDPRTEVVGIDEGQFFDDELPSVCSYLADLGKRVVVAGLDMDYRGVPFGPMPELLAIAEQVHKIQAICALCGAPASYTQRLTEDEERVLVGATGIYEARCRRCHEPEGATGRGERWLFPPADLSEPS
ncbi:MAG TPA: thymidine kinase [Candidatus Sulfomarinibacteraceae bacterium]|nr:thymidine kinase [Candidatus Sulfomarinibacteraceae bacterium]